MNELREAEYFIEDQGDHFTYSSLDGFDFERHCQLMLIMNGFSIVHGLGAQAATGKDHGIDILCTKVNKEGIEELWVVQCKCNSEKTGCRAVREAVSGRGYAHADRAMVISNNYFTNEARDEASKNGVVLCDYVWTSNQIIRRWFVGKAKYPNRRYRVVGDWILPMQEDILERKVLTVPSRDPIIIHCAEISGDVVLMELRDDVKYIVNGQAGTLEQILEYPFGTKFKINAVGITGRHLGSLFLRTELIEIDIRDQ